MNFSKIFTDIPIVRSTFLLWEKFMTTVNLTFKRSLMETNSGSYIVTIPRAIAAAWKAEFVEITYDGDSGQLIISPACDSKQVV